MTGSEQVAKALRKTLVQAIKLWKDEDAMRVAGKIAKPISDTQSFIEFASFSNPGLPQARGEGEDPPEGRFDGVWDDTWTATKYILQVVFPNESWMDNQYRDTVIQNYAQSLMSRCEDRIEIIATTEFFTEADTLTGPDGQFYGDSDHALDPEAVELVAAGTASNILSPAGTVSIDTLNRAYSAFMTQVDNKGVPKASRPPFDIECHPIRVMAWSQLKTSSQEPRTANHGDNPWGGLIGDIVPMIHATDQERTAFRGKNHRRFIWRREAPTVTELTYDKNDTYWANVKMRVGQGEFDWRDTLYSFA